MLTPEEFRNIKRDSQRILEAEANDYVYKRTSGIHKPKLGLAKAALLHYAIGSYDPRATDNVLTERQVRAIYSRLREISHV